jgi:nucleoside-diphosphate-sugar epimerase
MNKKRILVLGGAGYIGTVLSEYLYKEGYNVTVVDQCWFGNNLRAQIPLIEMDIFRLTVKDLESYHTVLFLAGLSNDPMAEFSPKDNFIYNTALPAYIGYIAREAGVKRLFFASSCSVYGYTVNKAFSETDHTVCNYPYGISKLQGEQALLALADESFSVVCFRQGTVCGYSPRMRLDLAINTMFKNALQKGVITLSNHKIWRPILGLDDLCRAYHLAIEADLEQKNVFNISSFNTTVGELAKSVAAFVKEHYKQDVQITDQNIQDYRNYKVSIEKATSLLNYKPKQHVNHIIHNLHEHLASFSDFDDAKFYNIEVFKEMILSKVLVA